MNNPYKGLPQNVLLISPHRLPGLKESRGSLPVSLLHLASVLRRAGHKPEILDLSVISVPIGSDAEKFYALKIEETVSRFMPSLIGLNCFSSMHFPIVRKLAAKIRAKNPDMPICLGGVHPTFFPHEILANCPEIDFIATGEGEEQIAALADTVGGGDFRLLSDIQALAYKKNGNVIVNPRKNFIAELDALPAPAYDMIDFSKYCGDHSNWHNPGRKDIKLSVPIFTTRSCPFNCNFCSAYSVMGRQFRRRDPKKVVDEIEMLARDFGQNYFSFSDDNVNLDKKHFMAVCEDVARRNLGVQLCIAQGFYLNAVDEDMVRAFVEAGGITVSVPIESGSDFIRNKIVGKRLKEETIFEIVGILKKYNLFTVGLFIIGFPEETAETLNDTLIMIEKLGLDVNGVNTLVPFPGTKVYQQASKDGLLLFDNSKIWDGEIFFDPQNKQDFFIRPYNLKVEELRCFRKIFDDLYLTSQRAKFLNNHP